MGIQFITDQQYMVFRFFSENMGIVPSDSQFCSPRCRVGNPGCGATISACSRVGHWPLALALLSAARARRQPLGDSSCNAAISSCARVVAWSRALWILQELNGDMEVLQMGDRHHGYSIF